MVHVSAMMMNRSVTRLRALRESAGFSQDELAAQAAISQSKLSRVERGYLRLTADERFRLATILDTDPDTLLWEVGLKERPV